MPTISHARPRALIALSAGSPRVPPTSFRIWELGNVATVKGTFLFDGKSAAEVMKEWNDWGNRLTFDYGHDATLGARGEDGKSAGSCNLELRDDGLWAVDVRWTDKAATELAAGEWLYFSPTFLSDKATGRIKSLINIALTNVPATKNMAPLVAASRKRTTMTREEVLKHLAAAKSLYGDALVVSLAADGDEAGDAESEEMKNAKTAKRAEAAKKLAKCKLEYESALRECAAFGEEPADDVGDGGNANAPPKPKDKPDATTRTAAARAAATATGTARIAQLAWEVTGGATEAEVLGKLRALSAIQEEQPASVEMAERISQLETTVFTSQASALMKVATDQGRLTPKQRAYALRIDNMEELTAYLDTLPVVAKTRGTEAKPDEKLASSMTLETLEGWEVEMCDRMGTSKEDYLAQKKANAERRQGSQAPKPVARKTAAA